MKPVKPLWGFGWAGWCLLPVAIALVWCSCKGPDLRFKVLEFINDTLGIEAVYQTVLGPIYHNWLTIDVPGLGWWGLLYVPIALHVHPQRRRWWWGPLVAWAALRPELYARAILRPGALPGAVILASSGGLLDRESAALLTCCAIDLALLWGMSRSWMVLSAACGATVIAIACERVGAVRWTSFPSWFAPLQTCAWHGIVAGALWWWAIGERLKRERPEFCKGCGYDLRGLAEARCPECGDAFGASTAAGHPASGLGVHSPP